MRGIQLNGPAIKQHRKSLGLTQQRLAFQAECDTKTIRKAENSKRVDVDTALRIATALGVAIGELVESPSAERQQQNTQVAETWVEAFNARDPEAVADCFHKDGAIHVLAEPSIPGAGEFRGREQVRQWAQTTFETFHSEPVTRDMYAVDAVRDYVFLRVENVTVKCLPSGKQTKASAMWEFTIRGGKIVRLKIYPESGAMEAIYRP
jgi:transcriptional regulator with XRE-family HTH domain